MASEPANEKPHYDYRKVSYFIGDQVVFSQKIPLRKSKLEALQAIKRETKSLRPYSSLRIRNVHGTEHEVVMPLSILQMIKLLKSI